jgi:hypothetical protein
VHSPNRIFKSGSNLLKFSVVLAVAWISSEGARLFHAARASFSWLQGMLSGNLVSTIETVFGRIPLKMES